MSDPQKRALLRQKKAEDERLKKKQDTAISEGKALSGKVLSPGEVRAFHQLINENNNRLGDKVKKLWLEIIRYRDH